jgi:hypothetical protein
MAIGCRSRASPPALETALTVGKLILLAERFEATKTADPPGKVLTSQPLNHCSYGVSTYYYDILSVSLVPAATTKNSSTSKPPEKSGRTTILKRDSISIQPFTQSDEQQAVNVYA